jgi:exodeoxyribonuclease VII small subunit
MTAGAGFWWSVWIMTETYEQKIEQLRQIIAKIEDGGTSLDESMKLYEQGAALVKQCETLLAGAEEKISTLSRDA